jgi:hypothetical protein
LGMNPPLPSAASAPFTLERAGHCLTWIYRRGLERASEAVNRWASGIQNQEVP